jgi:hypothetical protein
LQGKCFFGIHHSSCISSISLYESAHVKKNT